MVDQLPHPVRATASAVGNAAVPAREIRAHFTEESVFVYQAFRPEIAMPSVQAQRFVAPFSRSRMTWIKPSFAWMMYRSGWGSKSGQERILRVELSRVGFERALSLACVSSLGESHFTDETEWKKALRDSPVRIQWDPERTLQLEPLPWRTIQIGVGAAVSDAYVNEWVRGLEDVTDLALEIREAVHAKQWPSIDKLLPLESPYPTPRELWKRLGIPE